jgi:hypothetical protein
MSRTIFNELGENRVINPRSGSSVFVDLSSNQIIYGNKTFMNDLITKIIKSNTYIGYQPSIYLDNRFIDTNNSSLDIIATYVGFPHPSQTLTTASNYMYIKPLATGDFEMRILNKTKFILKTDIALNGIGSQIAWVWLDESNIVHALINPNSTAGSTNNAVCKFYARTVNKSLFYTLDGIFGAQVEPEQYLIWTIDAAGNIFTNGNIQTNSANGVSTNKINQVSGTTISTNAIWNFNNIANQIAIILDAKTIGSGNRLEIFGTAGGIRKLYYNTNDELGCVETLTTFWKITGAGAISCSSLNASSGTIQTTGSILTNTLNQVSGTTISTTAIWDFKNGIYTPIILDTATSSGDRLKIIGALAGTRYLFFNTSNNIGVYNTATAANVWSIDGTTGNINTIGTLTYATFSATSFLCNSISPVSGTTINIGITSNFNWLKSAGVNRIKFFPSSTSGDIVLIARVGDTSPTSGYHYFNNSGNFGYHTAGSTVWELLNNGDITTTTQIKTNVITPNSGTTISINPTSNFNILKSVGVSRILMFPSSTSGDIMQITRTGNNAYGDGYWYFNNIGNQGYNSSGITRWELKANGGLTLNNDLIMNDTGFSFFCNTWYAQSFSTYRNVIRMNTLTTNASISGMTLSSQYIDFIHPSITPTVSSKYFFILPTTDGNAEMYINNISGKVLATQHSSFGVVIRQISTDYRWVFNALTYTFAQSIIGFTIAGTSAGAVIMSSPSTVTYANSSDYRLKQDITKLDDALDSLMLLKPVIYRMKHDVEAGYNGFFQGFLAHEVENIIPNIVSGVKDDPNMMQQLDYSKFTPLLTGAVQELNKKVEKQQILIDKQQILIDSLISRLDKLENNNHIVEGT